MKAIVLAGGRGTRLAPLTNIMSKQFLPVYDVPMIFLPVSLLISAGIREILIISTPRDVPLFQELLGGDKRWNASFEFAVQEEPNGLPEAFLIGESFLNGSPCVLALGDNIFLGSAVHKALADHIIQEREGASFFVKSVADPSAFGVLAFDDNNKPVDLVEKPRNPPSDKAVLGLYVYDHKVCDYAKTLKPSQRGELEICDLNRIYLREGQASIVDIGDTAWFDAGTHQNLLKASQALWQCRNDGDWQTGQPPLNADATGLVTADVNTENCLARL